MCREGIRTENQHFSKWRKAVVGAGPGTPSCGLFKPPTEGPDGLMASLLRTQCAQLYMYMTTATNYCNVELYIAWTVSHYSKADLCLWKNWNTAPLNPTSMCWDILQIVLWPRVEQQKNVSPQSFVGQLTLVSLHISNTAAAHFQLARKICFVLSGFYHHCNHISLSRFAVLAKMCQSMESVLWKMTLTALENLPQIESKGGEEVVGPPMEDLQMPHGSLAST